MTDPPGATASGRSPALHIVTFNSAGAIAKCLESLATHAPRAAIVVVDNGSEDGSADVVEDFASEAAAAGSSAGGSEAGGVEGAARIRLIRNSENRGFAAAANQAAAASGAGLAVDRTTPDPDARELAAEPIAPDRSAPNPVIFLNPDTEVCEGWLENLCAAFADPAVGVVGCKILGEDGQTLQHMGGLVRANGLTEHIGRGEVDEGQYDQVSDVEYVTGAAIAIRRQVWDALGGFDTGYYPAYFEELELCWRARASGYRVVVEPKARVLHLERGSFQKSGDFRSAYHRNRIRFVLRNFGIARFVFRSIPAELYWMLTAKPRRQFGIAISAYLRGLAGLPKAIGQRWGRK
jgi:GT2 family glycosyltransferase